MTSAGVTELSLGGRGPRRAFVFDPHRLALPCWAESVGGGPAVLVTLDRHFDLVPPEHPPSPGLGAEALDAHTRTRLDPTNVDHVLAAMEAGVVSHAIVVARSSPRGAVEEDVWADGQGRRHELVRSPRLESLTQGFGTASASPVAERARGLLESAGSVLLDVDLDCFTTPSDADPTTVIPWPAAVMRDFLLPAGSEPFWSLVLSKCVALTVAREPLHCGGLIAAGRLFEDFARIMFVDLLRADLP